MQFDEFGLNPQLFKNIQAMGYETPTPIQEQAIPPILHGKDVVALAQTGTGKTAAFMLPLLQRLMQGPRHVLRALVVCPTRELAEQTYQAGGELGAGTNLHAVTIYGGVGMGPQVSALRRGAEIAIACPGRLLDHVRQRTIRLDAVEYLVLDEADRMFDMGFLPDVRQILQALPSRRQTVLCSATMPVEIRKLAHEVIRDPVTLQVAHSRPAATVSHALYPVPQHLKAGLLLAILEQIDRDSVLVFTRTKHRASRLAEQLNRAGHRATSMQGNLSQRQRTVAMDGFRRGHFRIMVATDLAARGIDVSSISHVINFDMPHTEDDYTHRIGRTGRAAKTGDAFTLITPEDEAIVRRIERVLGARIERRKVEGFDYYVNPSPQAQHHTRGPGGHGHGGRSGGSYGSSRPHSRYGGSRPGMHRSRDGNR